MMPTSTGRSWIQGRPPLDAEARWQQRLDGRPDLIGDQSIGHGWCRHGHASFKTSPQIVKNQLL
jgi:hypothetical protein